MASRWVFLCHEIDAASSLMRHGFTILRAYTFASRDAEAVFVCFAGGVEKLLKLTVGVVAEENGDGWPKQATMKGMGHHITALDETVRGLIADHTARSTAPGYIRNLLTYTAGHTGVVMFLRTLERYAREGRFYNLDLLGGREQAEAPLDLWNELNDLVVQANPELLELLITGDGHEGRREMNEVLAASIASWCELVKRSWMTGVCGAEAMRWSPSLDLGHEPSVPEALRYG